MYIKKLVNLARKVINKMFKYLIYGILAPFIYYKNATKKIQNDKVVFIELRHLELTNSSSYLYNELRNNYDLKIHCHFMNLNNKSRKGLIIHTIDLMKDVATAKYVFLNESNMFFSKLKVRKGTKIVQLWHGCGAFKKFGYSTAELIFGSTKRDMNKYPTSKNIDLITVSSEEVIWAYEEAMNKPKNSGEVKSLGVSRTDVFYDEEVKQKARIKLEKLFPEAKGKKVILYAPTFRGRVAKAIIPDMLRMDQFYKELSDEYVVLLKYHPLVKEPPVIKEEHQVFVRNMTQLMSIDDLLCVTDICISDYSSLIFEFSLFEKPMIFFAYDIEEFCDWRGFYYEYNELTPGPVCKTNIEMIEYIKNIEIEFNKEEVVAFKEKFMKSCDGNATQRIIQEVFGESIEIYKKNEVSKYNYARLLDGSIFFRDLASKMPEIAHSLSESRVKGIPLNNNNNKIKIAYKPTYRQWVGLEDKRTYLDLQLLSERLCNKVEILLVMPEKEVENAFPLVKYLEDVIKVVPTLPTKKIMENADMLILDYDVNLYAEIDNEIPVYLYQPDKAIYQACKGRSIINDNCNVLGSELDLINIIEG